ncbi:MAG: hypothetical protein OCC49_19815 [Fibrobacterales bacterium]
MKYLIALTISIVLLIAACKLAQENQEDEKGSIQGSTQIEDTLNKSAIDLDSITIKLYDATSITLVEETRLTVESETRGTYSFINIPEGEYYIGMYYEDVLIAEAGNIQVLSNKEFSTDTQSISPQPITTRYPDFESDEIPPEKDEKRPENSKALCHDDIDNDQDGYFDMDDQDCIPYKPIIKYENTMILCTDDVDNDSDGGADCGDLDCDNWCSYSSHEGMPEETSSGDTEQSIYDCTDDIDNDSDDIVDCDDPDCNYFCKRIEKGPSLCTDGYDNDEDGYIDAKDSDCSKFYSNDDR